MSKAAQVRTRKRGKTWSYIFEAGRKDDGKRKVVEKGGFDSKQAAYDAGVSAYTDWKHGNIGITSEKITVKDFITNWLENVVALNVKPTSLQTYQSLIKKHIITTLGDKTIQDLTPAILDKWLRDLLKAGYSKNSLNQIHAVIHHALDYAVYPAELITSNPSSYIKVPKKAPTNIVKRHIISQTQLDDLLAKYPFGTAMYMPILILFHTGIRVGELLGLTWDDVDFEKKTIVLRRQLVYLSRKGHFFTSLKTEASNRYIIIDEILSGELQRWKAQQRANEQEYGDSYVYVYQAADGEMLQQSKGIGALGEKRLLVICTHANGKILLKNACEKILRENGLNAHSFRHTHATLLIENGATPKGVAGRLGHSNTLITQNLYAHNTQKLQEDTVAVLEKILQTKP